MHDSALPLNSRRPPRRDRGSPLRDHRLDENRSLLTHLIRLAALGSVFAASAGSIPPFETSGRVGDAILLCASTLCHWGALRTPVHVWTGRVFSIPGFWLATFVVVYALSAFSAPSATAFKHTAQIVVVSVVFLFFSTLDRQFVESRSARIATILYTLYLTVAAVMVNQRLASGDLVIKNAVGGAVFGIWSLAFYLYSVRYPSRSMLVLGFTLYMITGLAIALVVAHRAIIMLFLLTLPMFMSIYVIWNTPLRRLLFWATCGLIVLNVTFNLQHEDLQWAKYLHEASINTFGRQFFSGREDIWSAVLHEISFKPWFGHGAGVLPVNVINTDLSSHNLYLQVLLQVGVIGLIPLALFFRAILVNITQHPRSSANVLAAMNVAGIMLYNCYEVVLTQNTLAIGVIEWTLIGLAFVSQSGPDDLDYGEPT